MKRLSPGIIGFLVAPLAPAIWFAMENSLMDPQDVVGQLMWLPLIYVPALFITGVFGVPLFLLLRRFDVVRWWSATAVGTIIGGAVGFALQLSQRDTIQLVHSTVCGAIGAFAFWVIWHSGKNSTERNDSTSKDVLL